MLIVSNEDSVLERNASPTTITYDIVHVCETSEFILALWFELLLVYCQVETTTNRESPLSTV